MAATAMMKREAEEPVPTKPTPREICVRRLVGELKRSGLTQREFARRQGVSAGTLSWWRYEIRRRDRARKATAPAEVRPTFIPVRVLGGPQGSWEGAVPKGDPYEVVLRSERLVRVPRDFDAQGLAVLVRVLEGDAC